MKKVLLGTTALLGAGMIAGTAVADDGIKLSVGGFFRETYVVTLDDKGQGELGNNHKTDGFYGNQEIHFKGEVTLDNGITVGVRVELEGEQSGDQIDESFVYFSGDFGKFVIGSDDDSLAANCVTPPSSTANFGAFSPNNWGGNDAPAFSALGLPSSNTICTSVDGDSQRIVYYSPSWSGFSFSFSYTPNSAAEGHTNGGGVGAFGGTAPGRTQLATYLNYSYEGDGWGLSWGGGAAWDIKRADKGSGDVEGRKSSAYQTGLVLTFGGFSVGGAFEIFDDFNGGDAAHVDAWVVGGGISYNVDAWTVGLGFSHMDATEQLHDTDDDPNFTRNRIALTGVYNMGPGIDLDAALAYTWTGADEDANNEAIDEYNAFEIGVGTAISF